MDIVQKHDRATLTERRKRPSTKTKEKDTDEKDEKDKLRDPKKLKKKLIKVSEKNETLAQAITDKNQEIAELKRSLQSLNDVLNSVPIDELRCNSSIASTKILELSKKNRQLRAELETTKNRVSKKDLEMQKMERDLKATEEKHQQDLELVRKGNFTPFDEMQGKINSLQQKLFETRNKNVELNTQLKLAHKCLQQEVGESFNLNILASQSVQSNWRGRAQQILHLQQKLHELKERLDMYEHHATGRISSYSCPPLDTAGSASDCIVQPISAKTNNAIPSRGMRHSNSVNVFSMTSNDGNSHSDNNNNNTNTVATFDRFSPGVRKSEIIHRAKVEALEKEIDALRMQLDNQRGKILALKVRNKTLNDEVLKYKMKTCTLEEQTDFNGMNLASMNEKLNLQRYQFENRLEETFRKLSDAERKREEAECKEDEMRSKLENMEELLSSKDDFIMELNGVVKKLEDDLKAICGGFLFSCRELRKEEFIAILDSLEAEKNHLLDHNKDMTERLEQERKKNDNLSDQLTKHKIRISRMDAKLRELDKELEVQTERKKRTQRITEYANSVNSVSGSLQTFVFESNSSIHSLGGDSMSQNAEWTQPEIIDLKNRLEFATEKITLLEEKVAHLNEEKESDAKTFQEILTNSKSILLDTLMSQKSHWTLNTSMPDIDTQ